MYYTVRKTDREWYGSLPERFTDAYLYWWCENNEEDYEYMLDMICIDDNRDDFEVARDLIRPIKDRLLEVHNILCTNENYPYDKIAEILLVEYMDVEELFNMKDYADLFYKGMTDGENNEDLRNKLYGIHDTIEDVIYDAIHPLVETVVKNATKG